MTFYLTILLFKKIERNMLFILKKTETLGTHPLIFFKEHNLKGIEVCKVSRNNKLKIFDQKFCNSM